MTSQSESRTAVEAGEPQEESATGSAGDQHWDPDRYARNARFVADLGAPVVDLLAPVPGEYILDLGCGDGALTLKLQEIGCQVIGVDSSAEQIQAARELGLDARVVDGHALDFDDAFDAVFSNAALHWMKHDPDAVISGVYRSLKPGGRFVGEFGGQGNVSLILSAMETALRRRDIDAEILSPWFFPSAEEYAGRLENAGFEVQSARLIDRPTELPGPITDWLDTFADAFFTPLPEGERIAAKQDVADEVKDTLLRQDGVWMADYVRLRFRAIISSG